MKHYFLNTEGGKLKLDTSKSFMGTDGNRYPAAAFRCLSEEELAAIGVEVEEGEPERPEPGRATVSNHAEVLIEQGTQINGIQFKCDERSVERLREVIDGFKAGLPEASQTKAMTQAGVLLEFDTQEKAQALYNAACVYRSKIITRSAEIQNELDQLQQDHPQINVTSATLWDVSKTFAEAKAALPAS